MMPEVFVLIHLSGVEAHLHLLLVLEIYFGLSLLFLYDIWICLDHVVGPVNGLSHCNQNIFAVLADLDESGVRARGLALFFKRVIVFYAIYSEVLQKVFRD